MAKDPFFEEVIKPDIEQVPVLEIVANDHDGRAISHVVRRNVFTDFDRKLSQHLAAIQGRGFPAISCSVRACKSKRSGTCRDWKVKAGFEASSVPEALLKICESLLAKQSKAALTIYQNGFGEEDRTGSGLQTAIERENLNVMRAALAACQLFGENEFVSVAGDFDMITLAPPGGEVRNVTMDLFNRTVAIPGARGDVIEAPLFDLQRHVEQSYEARAYLGNARQALLKTKEEAVLRFREAAEDRILRFETALKGRALTGHRQDAVEVLVARLRAGLGDTLSGLSEHARITALDWSTEIAGEAEGRDGPDADWMSGQTRGPDGEDAPFVLHAGMRA